MNHHGIPIELTTANIRAGWAEFLARVQWECFVTLTYATPVHTSEKVLRDFNRWLYRWQADTAVARGLGHWEPCSRLDAYGRVISEDKRIRGPWANSYRKGRGLPVWVLGVEQHKSGTLHAHALIEFTKHLPDPRFWDGWELWFKGPDEGGFGHGFARLETPSCQDHVAGYVAKYVGKGDEIFISPTFNARRITAA